MEVFIKGEDRSARLSAAALWPLLSSYEMLPFTLPGSSPMRSGVKSGLLWREEDKSP